jgi:hypothetical protein
MGERAGREAEIEAVIRALVAEGCGSGWAAAKAHKIIDALDAVRARSPQGEDQGPTISEREFWTGFRDPPQGEDHEASIYGGWRVGRKVGRTIYRMRGNDPSDDDELIGVMDTPALAVEAVDAVNLSRVSPSPERDTVRRGRVIAWLWQRYGEAAQQEFRRDFPVTPKVDEQEQG